MAAGIAVRVGVLAIQGGFEAHAEMLRGVGAFPVEVRRAAHLESLDALVLPGGESTTIWKGMEDYGLTQPVRDFARRRPVLGTCAGMILMAKDRLGLLDIDVERNAFGRQVYSFETDVALDGMPGEPIRAIFIRAPRVARLGDGVDSLASVDGYPVLVTDGRHIAAAFHPELGADVRLHEMLATRALDG